VALSWLGKPLSTKGTGFPVTCSCLRPPLGKFTETRLFGRFEERHRARASALSLPIRPWGPTTNGRERAFQLPLSRGCQLRPSSRLMSEPLVPTVIQSLSASLHWTEERYPWGGMAEAVHVQPPSVDDAAAVLALSFGAA
jgi:hypothetical protein